MRDIMPGFYSPPLVVLSVLTAIAASYTALAMAGRVFAARGGRRRSWLAAGGVALGIGIWSMHFLGMLAFRLRTPDGASVPMGYDMAPMALSVLVAVAASWGALVVAARRTLTGPTHALASLVMGAAIAGMHYIGMASMRMPARLSYASGIVALSVAIAVVASGAALWLAFTLRSAESASGRRRRFAAAAAMGVAIAGMHYTAMAAARFAPAPPAASLLLDSSHVLATGALAWLVGVGALVVLALALVSALVDRRMTARRAAEEAVRVSEARYRALIEASTQMVWVTDAQGMVDDMPFWRRLTGQSRDEVRGEGWLAAIHPEDRQRVREAWWQAYQTRGVYASEYRLRHADGHYRWYRARGVAVLAPDGTIREWVGVFNDVHEERAAADRKRFLERVGTELVSSLDYEETLRTLTRRCVPDLADYCSVDILDEEGEIRRVETAHADPGREPLVRELWARYPYSRSDRLGAPEVLRSGAPTIAAEFPSSAVEAFARDAEHLRLLRAVGARSYVAVPLAARGRTFGVLSLVYAESGRRYGAAEYELAQEVGRRAGVAVDNARLFAAEREAAARAEFLARAGELLASSLEYEQTFRSVTALAVPRLADWCTVDVLDEQGVPQLVAVAHVDPGRVEMGREYRRRFPSDPEVAGSLAWVIRNGKPSFVPVVSDAMIEASVRDPERRALALGFGVRSVIIVPIAARGHSLGAISFVRTTESDRHYLEADLRLAEELARRAGAAIDNARLFRDAEQANRAKTDFLATMSHELRTPLNAIAGYAELLALGVRGPVTSEQTADLERIQRSQRHLLTLVNDVLNFARIESGRVRYDIRDLALDEVVRGVEPLIRPQVEAKQLEYVCHECAAPLAVRADREKLQQIVLNLVSNAVKFTEPGGRVEVQCGDAAPGGLVTIRVRDTGRGIAADEHERIFEAFVQGDRGLTRTTEGVGLGLAISRDLARAMGGEITVESEVGQGSTFTVTLPAAHGTAERATVDRRASGVTA